MRVKLKNEFYANNGQLYPRGDVSLPDDMVLPRSAIKLDADGNVVKEDKSSDGGKSKKADADKPVSL